MDMADGTNTNSAKPSSTSPHPASLHSFLAQPTKSMGPGANDNEEVVPDSLPSEIFEEDESSLPLPLVQATKPSSRSEEYRQLFHLPPEEVLVRDFNCAVQKTILLQGHMYLFIRYVCFYSNIFGYEKKKIIPLRNITSVEKAKTAGIFPNAIEIVAWGKKHFFGSFLSRDEAYRLIMDGWTQHSEHAKVFLSSQDTVIPSSQDQTSCSSLEGSPDPTLITLPDMNCGGRDIEEAPREIEESGNETIIENGGINVVDEQIPEVLVTNKLEEESTVHRASTHAYTYTWQAEDKDAPKVPEHFKMVDESKFPIDAEEFFRVFFSNDAASFAENFHRKCGDEDFQCTSWKEDRHFGHVRDVSFRHPVKFYFGSRFTLCQEVQRFRVYRNSHLVIETSQQMNDIPYGDYFRVEGLWDVERVSDSESNQCILRIFVNVAFSKKTLWKGKIEQGTCEECKEAYATWIHDAHDALNQMDNHSVKTIDGVPSLTTIPNDPLPPKIELTAHGNGLSASSEQDATDRQHLSGNPGRDPQQESNLILNSVKADSTVETLLTKTYISRSPPLLSNVYSGLSLHWKPGEQFALILALLFAVIIVITQIGIVIMLARNPNAQYLPSVGQTSLEYTGQSLQESKNIEMATWLERRVYYLEEEISMMEGRFKSINHELTFLKRHLQALDRSNSKKQPD